MNKFISHKVGITCHTGIVVFRKSSLYGGYILMPYLLIISRGRLDWKPRRAAPNIKLSRTKAPKDMNKFTLSLNH